MQTLIDPDDLKANLDREDWFVFDCRFSLADEDEGRRLFDVGHIPGAQYADLNRDLSAPVIPGRTGRHPLPDRDDFLARIGQWGVTSNARVIAYDDAGGAFAARLWWLFRWLGHRQVAVLDGGFRAWTEAGYPVSRDRGDRPRSRFEPAAPLTRTVSAEDILAGQTLVIDARDEARYRGEAEPIDPVAGHIPGALCLPFADNLDESQRFRRPDELRQRFRDAGLQAGQSAVCYCGSGVTATHNILALVHSGFDEPALYPGSWSEWITDPERPVERS